jgi:hypothetical protein
MSRVSATKKPTGMILMIAALAFLLVVPVAPFTGSIHGSVNLSLPPDAASARNPLPTAALQLHPGIGSIVGPVSGKYFDEYRSGPGAVAGVPEQVVIDPATATGFVANAYQGFTAFSLLTGKQLAYYSAGEVIGSPTYESLGVAVDPVSHRVFGSVYGQPSMILVLNESTFHPIQTVTLPGILGASFRAAFATYDPVSGRLFVQNISGRSLAVLGGTPLAFQAWVALPGISQLRYPSLEQGLPELLIPTGNNNLTEVQTQTLVRTNYTGAPSSYRLVAATYNPRLGLVYAANLSTQGGSGLIPFFTPTTHLFGGYYAGSALPTNVTGILYSAVHQSLILTSRTGSHYLAALNTTTAIMETAWSSTPGYYYGLIDYNGTGDVFAYDSGGTNQSLAQFAIHPAHLVRSFTPFSAETYDVAVDSAAGLAFQSGIQPFTVSARYESNASPAWTRGGPSVGGFAGGLGVDSGLGKLFSLDRTFRNVSVLATTSGAALNFIHLPPGAAKSLSVDPVDHYLYVEFPTYVQVYSTANYNLLQNITVNRTSSPVAVDPARGVAWLANVAAPNQRSNITELTPGNGTARIAGTVRAYVNTIAVSPDGDLYMATVGSAPNLTIFRPYNGQTIASLADPAIYPLQMAYDSAAGEMVYSSQNSSYLGFINITSHTLAGRLATPNNIFTLAYDSVTGTLVGGTLLSNDTFFLKSILTPAAPGSLALTPGNGTLSARWSAPLADGGAPVAGYNVSIGASATGPWTSTTAIPGTTLTATFNGLIDGTQYFVIVTASNIVGRGSASAPASAVPVGVPYPPTGVTLTSPSADHLRVSWVAPANTGGAPIVNYTVQFAATILGPWSSVSAGAAHTTTLSGLSASTSYLIRVVAWNSVGASSPSAAVTGSTQSTTGGLSSGPWLWVILGVVIAGVVGLAALLLMKRKRPGGTPPEWTPAGAPPPGVMGPAPATQGPPPGATGFPPPPPPGPGPPMGP